MGPRPVPAPWGILLKLHTVHCLVIIIISWKFEVNPLRIDEDMTGRWSWKRKKKNNNKTRLDQSNVLDWKVSSILLKTKFIISHIMLKYRGIFSIWFPLSIFELNPIVHDISPLKNIDDVIPLQPEDSPLNISRYFSFAFNDHTWKFGVNRSRIDWVMNRQIKQ